MMVFSKRNFKHTFGMSIASILALSGSAVFAQSLPGSTSLPSYDLNTTIKLALKSSTDLVVANNNLNSAAAAAGIATAGFLPTISTTDTYQHLDSPVTVAIAAPGGGTAQKLVAEAQNKEFLTAVATLPLDINGRIKATADAAKLQYLAQRFAVQTIYNNRILSAQTEYFNLLRAQHQLNVANSALLNAQTQEAIAQRQFEGGIGQKIDYLRAQTQVANANQTLLAAQNSLSVAQSNFDDLVGAPLGSPVTVEDAPGVTTGDVVSSDISALNSVTAPPPTFYTPNTGPLPDLEQGIAAANKQRPELFEDEVNVQADAKQITIARTGDEPSLSLSATGDYYPVTDFGTPRHSLGVYSVTLSWPIYDGGVTNFRVRQAKDQTKNAQATYSSDQTTVELQVRQAYENLSTTAAKISSTNTELQEAIAARALAQVRYSNGVGLYLEVTDAESALTQAETDQVNAVYDYLTARANYENAIGAPTLSIGL